MAAADAGGGDTPRELVIDAAPAPGDSGDGSGSAMAPFVLTALAAGMLAKYVSPTAALLPIAVAVVVFLFRWRAGEGRFVLRVENGAVEVTRERRKGPAVRVGLDDLVDVTLDRETRQTERGGQGRERVRIALERRAPDEPIYVPDERVTPIEAQEWFAKVRVFLRKHGWLPESERPPLSDDAAG